MGEVIMTREVYNKQVKRALSYYKKAKIVLTDEEKARIEVADFGLCDVENIGLEILTYINTDRVCAKEMVLTPYQTCPEHKHIGTDGKKGKEETFRVRYGRCFLYVEGEGKKENMKAKEKNTTLTVFKEILLNEGEQYTIYPNTLHWFQADKTGAVISEFSTRSTDETDVFTDERIIRETKVED